MPSSERLYVGLDAGGTTTRLLGRVLPEGRTLRLEGEGANPSRVGIDEAAHRLARLVEEARRQCPGASLAAVWAGVAGAGQEDDQQALQARLGELLGDALPDDTPPPPIGITHDAAIALEAAFGEGSGLILIAGTGSVAYARAVDGSLHRAGGWGYVLGDEGSGFAIGRLGLKAVIHALDGGPETQLRALFAERFGLSSRHDILHRIYRARWPLQNAVVLVLDAAAAGDAVAASILDDQTTWLARQAAWVVSQGADVEPRIALFGGLTGNATYVDALRRALHRYLPGWALHPSPEPPVAGALRLALRHAPYVPAAGSARPSR